MKRMRSVTPKPAHVLDGMVTAVVCLDDALAVTFANAAAEMLFAVSARQILGEPVDQAIPHLRERIGRFRDCIDTGVPLSHREMRLRKNGDEPKVVSGTFTPITDRRGNMQLLLEFLPLDRHLRITREDQLLAQHQLSREVVRGLAHEVKNPLGGLRGAAQLLERKSSDESAKKLTDIIIREADRLQRLVDRMLAPNRRPEITSLNVHAALEHVRELLAVDCAPGIVITRDYDPSLPDILADREQLVQAFLNIAGNALDAMGEQGELLLRTRARRQVTIGAVRHKLVAQIDICDTGPGISADMQAKIFYPMVTTRADGTGLGLSIAQTLVRSHGGLIECESRPGRTVFSVFLPITNATDEGP